MTEGATSLYRPAGSLAEGGWSVVLTPETAGWRFSGMRAATLAAGASLAFDTADDEVIVLPLAGSFDVDRGRRVARPRGSSQRLGRAE